MPKEYTSAGRTESALALSQVLTEMEQREPTDLKKGREGLIARIKKERDRLHADKEYRFNTTDDQWTSRLDYIQTKVASLLAIWEVLKHEPLSSNHPYKGHPQFVNGHMYLQQDVSDERRRLRRQLELTKELSTDLLDAYRRTRNELAVLDELRAPSSHSREMPLGKEYFLDEPYVRNTQPAELLRESTDITALWAQLEEGVCLGIETTEGSFHLQLHRARIASDRQLVLEGHSTTGQEQIAVHQPIRITTMPGRTPKAFISSSDHGQLQAVTIKRFFIEKDAP